MPVTEADGYLSATVKPFSGWPSALGATLLGSYSLSIAHMPVPVTDIPGQSTPRTKAHSKIR
jgi:hypothetical protein